MDSIDGQRVMLVLQDMLDGLRCGTAAGPENPNVKINAINVNKLFLAAGQLGVARTTKWAELSVRCFESSMACPPVIAADSSAQ